MKHESDNNMFWNFFHEKKKKKYFYEAFLF